MPFYLKPNDDISELTKYNSVLIIPCRFCPAASAAVKDNKPYIELFRRFLKTDAYERQIEELKRKLTYHGIRTEIFKTRWIHQFVLCMWSSRRRRSLAKQARNYDVLVVLGCEAATQTIRDAVQSTSCRVLQGWETKGVMSIMPRLKLPGTLSLELESVTPMIPVEEIPEKTAA